MKIMRLPAPGHASGQHDVDAVARLLPSVEAVLLQIPPGTYRARVSGRGYVAGAGEIEGHESYRLQLWPADESDPVLIKYWDGYDLMRPNG